VDKTRDLVSLSSTIKSYFHALYVLWVQAVAARAVVFAKKLSSAYMLFHTKHDQAAKEPSLPLAY
jgi:hypothetical protein